ncbi:MAG: hypothetical protein JO199_07850, partial [Candidatus Eremiobacteraeota bacterium]|nr:hypothetical protein [Candidatus Eremiobacteraeota bacterium]
DVDLVEEVARMEGYDELPSAVPSVAPHEISSAQYDVENAIARTLASLGYDEIVSLSLNDGYFDRAVRAGLAPSRRPVAVLNPISEDHRYLRHSLTPGLLEYFARLDAPARAFEIGHIFAQDDNHINESPGASFAFAAEPIDEPEWRDSNFLRIKGDCEAFLRAMTGQTATASPDERNGLHPGKTATMMIGGREVAFLGKIDPRLQRAFDVRLPVYICVVYLDSLPDRHARRYVAPSRFPSTYRDLALVVGTDVAAADLEQSVARALGEMCTGVRAFDEYRGPQVPDGKKSLALRATLARFDATITDEEADGAVERALAVVREELGATIRA